MIDSDYFFRLTDELFIRLQTSQVLLCHLRGENSDFVRFNHARVRQAGRVDQARIRLELVQGQKHLAAECDIGGAPAQDEILCRELVSRLQQQICQLEDDPFFSYNQNPVRVHDEDGGSPPSAQAIVEDICGQAKEIDLVGLLATGPLFFGFASSRGQRNWYSRASFNFDWSVYSPTQAAVKSSYVGDVWDAAVLAAKLDSNRLMLIQQEKPVMTVAPGRYRVYLAPAALYELMECLGANAFSCKSQRTGGSSFKRLHKDLIHLHHELNVCENHREGLAPAFTPQGFLKPDKVRLITAGRYVDDLISPRTAAEYALTPNCSSEVPEALQFSPGQLDEHDILGALDDGLYISNLWYTNFSDINACRITGMTRFACFRVKGGRIVAPLAPMRFDQSIYKLLGANLEALTSQCHWLYSADTYRHRSTLSMNLPGLLVRDFELTL